MQPLDVRFFEKKVAPDADAALFWFMKGNVLKDRTDHNFNGSFYQRRMFAEIGATTEMRRGCVESRLRQLASRRYCFCGPFFLF
jgi:hypothetical protein